MYYKVISNGVSRFIDSNKAMEFSKFKRDFDGKLVTEGGEPKVYTANDINKIKKSNNDLNVKVNIKGIFKDNTLE